MLYHPIIFISELYKKWFPNFPFLYLVLGLDLHAWVPTGAFCIKFLIPEYHALLAKQKSTMSELTQSSQAKWPVCISKHQVLVIVENSDAT